MAFDQQMASQRRHILLTVDNFAGHKVNYKPTNIQIEFFAPSLTSFIQPCDAGIIRSLKAYYQRAFCLRALEKDELNEREIYKINLLEAMLMVNEAWDSVTLLTILNCWKHTGIQP
jgi:hypothetical protein